MVLEIRDGMYFQGLFVVILSGLLARCAAAAIPATDNAPQPILHLSPEQLNTFRHPPPQAGHLSEGFSTNSPVEADKTVPVELDIDEPTDDTAESNDSDPNAIEEEVAVMDGPE